MMKKILKGLGLAIGAIALVVLLLDTFGGYFMDGPLGPIPGGRMSGPVADRIAELDWSGVEREIEIEVRPEQPWSLTVWRAVIDGDLYIPSGNGASRRWTQVAVEDPRVRVRSQGRIQEGCLTRVTAADARRPALEQLIETYGLPGGDQQDDGSVWLFRVDPRAACG